MLAHALAGAGRTLETVTMEGSGGKACHALDALAAGDVVVAECVSRDVDAVRRMACGTGSAEVLGGGARPPPNLQAFAVCIIDLVARKRHARQQAQQAKRQRPMHSHAWSVTEAASA